MAKKKTKLTHRWAWIVSRIFDPVIEIPILLAATAWVALMDGYRWMFLTLLIFVDAAIPAAAMLWGLKTGVISDWDMSKREERKGVFFFTVFCHLFGVVLALFLGKFFLFQILALFWTLAVVTALVTFFWKISVHAAVNAALLAFFNHFYGWDRYWWLVLVLVVVMWSRVTIKKHSWSQSIAGAALGLIWVSIGLGLISFA